MLVSDKIQWDMDYYYDLEIKERINQGKVSGIIYGIAIGVLIGVIGMIAYING